MILVAFLFCLLALPVSVNAQQKSPAPKSSLCTTENAIDTARQQIVSTRTFEDVPQRIAVLLRAADLLWPYEPDKALAAFTEAFDLALQDFKEHGDQVKRTSSSRFAAVVSLPDQRFKVLTALAKRDPVRARKLMEQMLQEYAADTGEKLNASDAPRSFTSEKLLQVARDLIKTDPTAATTFARQSFRYQASLLLTIFFYQFSKTNKEAADRLYLDALVAYSKAPMDQFLYLSAYPFGNTRDAGEMPGYTTYQVPDGYVPNPALQRAFMHVLLARAEGLTATPPDTNQDFRHSDQAQIWLALTRLEKHIQTGLPDLFEAAVSAKEKLFAVLGRPLQQMVTGQIESDNRPLTSFDQLVENAEKLSDVARRDQTLVSAVTGASTEQPTDKVLSVIDKISDSNIRGPLLNWFYYFRAQARIAEKNLTEARTFAAKVTELDQRAYLFTRIAEESLKTSEDQTEARALLNEISNAVSKAPKTIVSARALLALAYLYAKIDVNRGVEELSNAVRTINALESPDFSQQFVIMKIEGKTFGSFASFSTPGFNPENAFREMGKLDFDGSLIQATGFTDKSLRALTTLAVIEPCFATKATKKK